jgi:hypothetical protein
MLPLRLAGLPAPSPPWEHLREIEFSVHLVVPERNVQRKSRNGGLHLGVQSNEDLAVFRRVRVGKPRNRRLDTRENVAELLERPIIERSKVAKSLLGSIGWRGSNSCGFRGCGA